MVIAIYIFATLFGLVVGSFLNAVIYRLNTKKSPLRGRSVCPKCGKALEWYELIPILSFLIQKRRCRGCRQKISWHYPIVEITTSVLFLLIFLMSNTKVQMPNEIQMSNVFELLFLWFVASGLIVIFVYDLKHYIIPDKILAPLAGLTALAILFGIWNLEFIWHLDFVIWNLGALLNAALVGLLTSTFFFALYFFSKGRALGFGDVKLAFFMGLFLGPQNTAVAVFMAFVLGAIIGIGLIVAGKKRLKSKVPFGPFLITGTFIALFWGTELANWYFGLFKI